MRRSMHVVAGTLEFSFNMLCLLNENVVDLPLQNLCLHAHSLHAEVVVRESPNWAKMDTDRKRYNFEPH